jgi:hypothetical protein
MRTLKKLLELTLLAIDTEINIDNSGFCELFSEMFCSSSLSSKEYYLLKEFIQKEIQEKGLFCYLFPPNEWEIRKEFLKEKIKELA